MTQSKRKRGVAVQQSYIVKKDIVVSVKITVCQMLLKEKYKVVPTSSVFQSVIASI